jgi:hypothetical protein
VYYDVLMYEQQHPPVLYIIIPLGVGPELCELRRIPLLRLYEKWSWGGDPLL